MTFASKWKPPTKQRDREPQVAALLRPLRMGVITRCDELPTPQPKSEPQRNPHLLTMARSKSCLFEIPWVCNHDPSTTVAAHSNLGIHGKAGARKADDFFSAACCSECHRLFDTGLLSKEVKKTLFMAAHLRQVSEWRAIVADKTQPEKDRAAAQWALERLNVITVGDDK